MSGALAAQEREKNRISPPTPSLAMSGGFQLYEATKTRRDYPVKRELQEYAEGFRCSCGSR